MSRVFFVVAGGLFVAAVVSWSSGWTGLLGPAVIGVFACLALGVQGIRSWRSLSFTAWVLAFVSASMVYPAAFRTWSGFELKILIVPLIQLIMFGMGTTLSLADFSRVLTMPRAVLIGMVLHSR